MPFENLPDALSRFLQKIADDLRCPICQTTFKDPHSAPCNHTFCKDCIAGSQPRSSSKTDICPVCQSRIPKKGLISVKSTGKIAASFLEFFETLGYAPESNQNGELPLQILGNSIKTNRVTTMSMTQLLTVLKTDIDKLEPSLQSANLLDDLIIAVDQRILAQEKVLATKQCITPMSMKRKSSTCSSVGTTKKKRAVYQDTLLEEKLPCQRADKLTANSNPEAVIVAQPNKITLLGTNLNSTQKNNLSKLARSFGADVVNIFSSKVSHLITEVDKKGTARRTMKYFQAILRGIWLVSYEWVEASLQAKQLLSEEEFEISGDESHGSLYIPRKARLRAITGGLPLFHDLHVVLHGEFITPSKSDLIELITLGGGQIISKVKPEGKNFKVLCDKNADAAQRLEAHTKYGTIPLSADWILDCISMYELLNESMFSRWDFDAQQYE